MAIVAVPNPPKEKLRYLSASSCIRYVDRDVLQQRADGKDVYRPLLHLFIYIFKMMII